MGTEERERSDERVRCCTCESRMRGDVLEKFVSEGVRRKRCSVERGTVHSVGRVNG